MKIQVVRHDGSHEAITLTEPIEIRRGEHLNKLRTATGCDHFFTADGLYDGWGMAVNFDNWQGAAQFAQAVEADREITDLPPATSECSRADET